MEDFQQALQKNHQWMLLITEEKTRQDVESYDQHLVETRDCDLCNLKIQQNTLHTSAQSERICKRINDRGDIAIINNIAKDY